MMVQENPIELERRWFEAEEAIQGEAVIFSDDCEFPFRRSM